jgi:ArsR family transcriptional regulator
MAPAQDHTPDAASAFKALGDATRLHVLRALQAGELCACDLLKQLDISQSTLSHHMGILCKAQIVAARRSGKWTFYSLDARGCEQLLKTATRYLTASTASQKPTTCC